MPVDADRSETRGDHRAAATAFAERAREACDAAVQSVFLFGSVAAGHHRPTSDVDVLVVLADDADYGTVDDRLLDISYEVRLEYGVPVEAHTMRETAFETRRERGDPFVRRVTEEGERV